jgi:hypothetical protein
LYAVSRIKVQESARRSVFALDEIEMSWDYFMQSVGLQEQEKNPDTQIDDKGDEYDIKDKVSLEAGSSSKASQQPASKKRAPKTKGTPSSANRSTTLMKEEIPRMQLRSSTAK